MLTALAFLIVAPLPLLAHLGHPERSFQIFLTPHFKSAMAMFGFVYAWYLMVVLLMEIWFEYRADMVRWRKGGARSQEADVLAARAGFERRFGEAVGFDRKAVHVITLIGIPSAFLLHGYVGFIFGSIKANPWWSSVLMPIVFLFSAIVSGIALVLLLYYVTTLLRRKALDMPCLNKLASFLLYALIIDLSLETLDFIHRLYESEESIKILRELIWSKLFISLTIVQVLIGTIVPIVMLAGARFSALPAELKRTAYFVAALLVQSRDLQHSLERGDRRPAVLEEPARPDGLQAGAWRDRGAVHRDSALAAAVRGPVRADQTVAAVGGIESFLEPTACAPLLGKRIAGIYGKRLLVMTQGGGAVTPRFQDRTHQHVGRGEGRVEFDADLEPSHGLFELPGCMELLRQVQIPSGHCGVVPLLGRRWVEGRPQLFIRELSQCVSDSRLDSDAVVDLRERLVGVEPVAAVDDADDRMQDHTEASIQRVSPIEGDRQFQAGFGHEFLQFPCVVPPGYDDHPVNRLLAQLRLDLDQLPEGIHRVGLTGTEEAEHVNLGIGPEQRSRASVQRRELDVLYRITDRQIRKSDLHIGPRPDRGQSRQCSQRSPDPAPSPPSIPWIDHSCVPCGKFWRRYRRRRSFRS